MLRFAGYAALCQDCARPHMFDTERMQLAAHQGETVCRAVGCGGELCACLFCIAEAHRIGGVPEVAQ